jgi:hypothetical protein
MSTTDANLTTAETCRPEPSAGRANSHTRDCDHCDGLVTVVTVWWPNFFATVRPQCPR